MYPGTHALASPDKPAVICPGSGETLSYRALDDQSNRLAQLLHARGLRRGDHVALYCDNNAGFFVAVWACMRSGFYLTPINWHLAPAEAAYIVDDCDATALIASAAIPAAAELGALVRDCPNKLAIGGEVPGFTRLETATAAMPARPLEKEWLGSLMGYSSGTTGKPKGIVRPLWDRGPELGNPTLQSTADIYEFGPDMVYLSPAPLYHAAPIAHTMATIQAGGTVVAMERFEPEEALRLIERYRITHSQWVPTMFIRLLKLPEAVRSRYDLSSQRHAVHAAAPCPVEVKRRMIDWWGPIIDEYYSSTEAVAFTTITSEEWLAHPGSVGRNRGKPLHICDDDGNELPVGQPGQIYGEPMAGAAAFTYHKAADKTGSSRNPLHPEWVSVGDVGYLDAEGYLYLTDRKSFMIISGGVNIYPQQIEDALALHPKVGDVAVIGVPHPELGEEVKAIVEAAPGVEPSETLGEEIRAFVEARLGRQLTPRTVDFVDQLPRLPTGKLYKKALRDRYWGTADGRTILAAQGS